MTVRLSDGWVLVDTDPARHVLPSAYFAEISHVGFKPVEMEVRATGEIANGAFVVDGGRWPFVGEALPVSGPGSVRLKVVEPAADPPRVTVAAEASR